MANSKEDAYLDLAENMFVFQNFTREEIATRLKLGEKTVRTWAKKYGWEEKKARLLECKRATHQELYELTRTLVQGMRQDVEDKKEISWQRITAIKGLVETVAGLKKYEDVVQVEKEAQVAAVKGKENSEASIAEIRQQVHDVLGL